MDTFQHMSVREATMLSPLQLAFLGDAVYTLLCRTDLMRHDYKPNDLQRHASRIVRASSQHTALEQIKPLLTEEEMQIVMRGRNAHAKHGIPRHASQQEYQSATALETLFGFLFITGQSERLAELYDHCVEE